MKKAKEELKDYLTGMAQKFRIPRKIIGVALDGFNIMFMRIKPVESKKSKKFKTKLNQPIFQEMSPVLVLINHFK